MAKQRIAILTGGRSTEREVALASAQNVSKLLNDHYDVIVFDFPADQATFIARHTEFAAAVPIFHGVGGEDGSVQGFLQYLQVPYIFSSITTHAIAINKDLTKTIVAAAGLNVPEGRLITSADVTWPGYGVVLKSVAGGSSIGVFLCHSEDDLMQQLNNNKPSQDNPYIMERFISGKEFTVPIVDLPNGTTQALPVIEIRSHHSFFDYASKYDPSLVEELCPAPIDDNLAQELEALALKVHRLLGARHLTRSDFIVDTQGDIWFLEINTIPGLTVNSLVPKAVRVGGYDLAQLLAYWIDTVRR